MLRHRWHCQRMDTSAFRRHAPALSIVAFTLALRVATTWRLAHSPYGVPLNGDMRFYAQWAQRIADGQLTDFHAFYGQPLYAYVLGGLFALVGFQPILVGLLQSCADAATALLIIQIGRLAFPHTAGSGRVVGGAAAIGWALFVPAAAYAGLFIPAAWATLGWCFGLWWLLARSPAARLLEWFGIAVLIGALAMMSATILFALPMLAVRAISRRRLKPLLAVAIGVIVGTAPASLHNSVVARDPVFLSAHSGLNFWIGNNPDANGYPRIPRDLPSEQAALLEQSIKVAETAAGKQLPRSEVSAFWSARAHDFIAADPWRWLRLVALKLRSFWSAFEYDDLSSITALRDVGVVPGGLSFGMVAAFGLPGLLVALRDSRSRVVALAVLLQMAALLPVFVNERYRLAAAPPLLLLAAFFLAQLWRAMAAAAWRHTAVALALVACSMLGVSTVPADAAMWSLNDYKTARRHILAGEFSLGEMRMRRALEAVLVAQPPPSAVANGFAEVAQEQVRDGDAAAALKTVDAAVRINPADQRLVQLRERLAASAGPRE